MMTRRVTRFCSKVFGAIYRLIAGIFSKVSLLTRLTAIVAPDFFLFYRGDALASVHLSEGQHVFRLGLAITLSILFLLYFLWDNLVVAGSGAKKTHIPAPDWDHAKAAMDADDPGIMGSAAWMAQRIRETPASTAGGD